MSSSLSLDGPSMMVWRGTKKAAGATTVTVFDLGTMTRPKRIKLSASGAPLRYLFLPMLFSNPEGAETIEEVALAEITTVRTNLNAPTIPTYKTWIGVDEAGEDSALSKLSSHHLAFVPLEVVHSSDVVLRGHLESSDPPKVFWDFENPAAMKLHLAIPGGNWENVVEDDSIRLMQPVHDPAGTPPLCIGDLIPLGGSIECLLPSWARLIAFVGADEADEDPEIPVLTVHQTSA